MLVMCERFDVFLLVWSGSIVELRQNIIKIGSKSRLLICSGNKL